MSQRLIGIDGLTALRPRLAKAMPPEMWWEVLERVCAAGKYSSPSRAGREQCRTASISHRFFDTSGKKLLALKAPPSALF
jgi:hypothetical protein